MVASGSELSLTVSKPEEVDKDRERRESESEMEGRRLDWTLRLAKTRGGEEEEEAAPSAEAPGGGVFSAAKQRWKLWAVSIHVNLGDPHGQNGKAEGEGGRERRKVEAG